MQKIIPQNAVLIPDSAKLVFNGVIYDVYQWDQPNFDDSVAVFEMLKRPDTVAVICAVDDKILVLQDEQPHRGVKLTLPGGRVDGVDEDILSAARREVKEETGHAFKNWKLVSVVQPQAKIEWFIHTYVAWNVTRKGAVHHDPGERIVPELITFEDFKTMAFSGRGFPGQYRSLVENLKNIDGLKRLPEYKGMIVNR